MGKITCIICGKEDGTCSPGEEVCTLCSVVVGGGDGREDGR
jgi:hypothetical protein